MALLDRRRSSGQTAGFPRHFNHRTPAEYVARGQKSLRLRAKVTSADDSGVDGALWPGGVGPDGSGHRALRRAGIARHTQAMTQFNSGDDAERQGARWLDSATSLEVLYDLSHNLAKIETHDVDGKPSSLCVYRKGATRSLPLHRPDLPAELAAVGQPVLIPRDAHRRGRPSLLVTGHTRPRSR